MNKILYRTAMDKVAVSEKLEKDTIALITEKAPAKTKVHKRNLRFLPVLIAAVVFVFGTAAVTAQSGGAEWFKRLFENSDFEMTEEISSVIGKIKNFTCDEIVGLKLSPIGMAADETEIYCTFNVDSIAEGIDEDEISYIELLSFGEEKRKPTLLGVGYDDVDSTLTAVCSFSDKVIKDNERVKMRIGVIPKSHSEENIINAQPEIYTDISFDVSVNDVDYLEAEYDEPVTAMYESQAVSVEKITVTPLHLLLCCNEINISAFTRVIVNFNDGTSVNALYNGSNHSINHNYDFMFDNPVNPKNIVSVYLGNDCIYDHTGQ